MSEAIENNFEIPRALSRDRIEDEDYNAAYDAARKHQKQLRKAESNLFVARDLTETLQGYLGETHIDECFTAGSIVDLIEKRINKARRQLDRHNTEHTNLFIAYFDLKGGAS